MNGDSGALKPYLVRSAMLHAGLVVAFLIFVRLPRPSSEEAFRIDFVGPSSVIINRTTESASGGPSKPAASSEKIAPQTTKNEFGETHHHAPLPRPSVLNSAPETPAAPSTPPAAPVSAPATGTGGGDAAVETEMPNFPYPWYISQVRSALWSQWKEKMPAGGGEAVVSFSIMKDGSAVDLRIESSSGDSSFDYVALGAVQGSLPFPPLPQGFVERFLKIHVRFKSQ